MGFLSNARFACLAGVGISACFSAWAARAAAADPMSAAWLRLPAFEASTKVIHVRKIANTLFHFGARSEDENPIQLGPATARLLWQKKWKWPEASREQKIPGGLLGGPMLSIDLPLGPLGSLFSLETRFCSFRYAYADLQTRRVMLEELADPRDQHQSFEGRLYLNISLASLF
jgi:hypothetical protein